MTDSPTFTPYISFPGNAGEAFAYYNEVFGGRLDLMRYDDYPDTSGFPFTPPPGAVAHAQLHGGAVTLAGGDDLSEGTTSEKLRSDAYSLLIQPGSVDAARGLIEKLTSTGGSVAMPFEQAPWGAYYGQVIDRFGVMWQFNVEGAAPQGWPLFASSARRHPRATARHPPRAPSVGSGRAPARRPRRRARGRRAEALSARCRA